MKYFIIKDISSYSAQAEYKKPNLSLKITNITCTEEKCYHVQDIDIFNDAWICFSCTKEFPMIYIENKLIVREFIIIFRNMSMKKLFSIKFKMFIVINVSKGKRIY